MNAILTYYQDIVDGSIVGGRWVRIFYENVVTGL